MQPHPVKLRRRHVPPARRLGAEHHLGHQVAPNQGLGLRGYQKVLLGLRQGVRQRGERAHQPPAGVRRPAGAVDLGGAPGGVVSLRAQEIVAAHEDRVGVQDLRPGRRVIGVIESQQRIAQQRRQQPAHLFELFGVLPGLLDGCAQVQFSLGVDMFVGPVAEAHGVHLDGGKRSARDLNVPDDAGQFVDQRDIQLLSLGQGFEVIGEVEKGVESDNPLGLQDALDLLRNLLMGVAIGRFARGCRAAAQQAHHTDLGRALAFAGRGGQQAIAAVPAGVEQLAIVVQRAERAGDGGEHGASLVIRKGLLPHQDLPQAYQPLEGSGGIGAESRIVDLVEGFHGIQKLQHGLVADAGRFVEDGILRAEIAVVPHQAIHGGGLQRLRAVAIQVAEGHENLQRLVVHGLAAKREESLDEVVGLFPGGRQAGQLAVVFGLGIIGEETLPNFQVAGDMGLTVGIQMQPRSEQHHIGIGPKDGPRRSGTGDSPTHRAVKALQALGLEQVVLQRAVDARDGIVKAGQPAIVFGQQLIEELRPVIG